MEVVLLAHITFNRIGSASSGGGFSSDQHRQKKISVEVVTKDHDNLRNLVIEIAEKNGEAPGSLEYLQLEHQHYLGDEYIFNIHSRNTFYGNPYVVCQLLPALKANEKYYQLNELDVRDFSPYTPSTK